MQVKLLEFTPNPEQTVCTAARNDYSSGFVGGQSFDETMEDVNGETIEEKKRTLIEHLMKHGHWGPAEHVTGSFAIEGISRSCMAQITRHRHASFDVQSQRYVDFSDVEVVRPDPMDNADIGRNSDMANEYEDWNDSAIAQKRGEVFDEAIDHCFDAYREILDYGVAPEWARYVLPIGTKVNMVMTMNLRALLHLEDMRGAADAQAEIRELTNEILALVEEECPIVMDIWKEEMKGRKNRLGP